MKLKDADGWAKAQANNQDPYGGAVMKYAEEWANAMEARLASPELDLAELAWGIIANAGGGDWKTQSADWQDAAARWREKYHAALKARPVVADVAEQCEPKGHGISGFMYGAAVSTLVAVWEHGEALKQWHNGNYGQPEVKGVVNPALITIST